MVRISLPGRLKSYNSTSNDRSISPNSNKMKNPQQDSSPDSAKVTGLMLRVVVLKVSVSAVLDETRVNLGDADRQYDRPGILQQRTEVERLIRSVNTHWSSSHYTHCIDTSVTVSRPHARRFEERNTLCP